MESFDLDGAIDFVHHHADIINMNIVDLHLPSNKDLVPDYWLSPELLSKSALELAHLAGSVYADKCSFPQLSLELKTFLESCRKFALVNGLRYTDAASTGQGRTKLNERKSEKKRHEVELLGQLINSSVASSKGVAVDFGAGQGYLSQALADSGWQVVALERDDGQCHGSIVRQEGAHRPYKVAQINIDSSTDTKALEVLVENGESDSDLCFCSLHACGSLSIDMLRLFLAEPRTTVLANVGCCYNLMREQDCPPLSRRLAPHSDQLRCIGVRTARMLACQAPWRWASRPIQTTQSFRSNHYRALFQAFVLPSLSLTEEPELGHLPLSALSDFTNYVQCACERLSVPVPLDIDLRAVETEHDLSRTAVIWTLRALLGPAIESILLLDRFYWVRENIHGDCRLIPLFDPVKSPRNFVLHAKRNITADADKTA